MCLVALVPTIGLVQVGSQRYADRFMHLPMVGLLVIVVWGAADVLKASLARWAGAVVIAALAVASALKTPYWRATA